MIVNGLKMLLWCKDLERLGLWLRGKKKDMRRFSCHWLHSQHYIEWFPCGADVPKRVGVRVETLLGTRAHVGKIRALFFLHYFLIRLLLIKREYRLNHAKLKVSQELNTVLCSKVFFFFFMKYVNMNHQYYKKNRIHDFKYVRLIRSHWESQQETLQSW